MRISNFWMPLSVMLITACQLQTAVQTPGEPATSSASVSTPTEAVAPVAVTPAPPAAEVPQAASTPAITQPSVAKKAAAPVAEKKPVAAIVQSVTDSAAIQPATTAAEQKPPILSEKEALALAGTSDCLACHAIDKKVFGPAWRDVAVKYRGDAGAEARLVEKVGKGGSGAWGNVPMPAHPKLSEADRRALVRFVLSLK